MVQVDDDRESFNRLLRESAELIEQLRVLTAKLARTQDAVLERVRGKERG